MSGIYGFVYNGADTEPAARARVEGLQKWNRMYGRDGGDVICRKGSAVGCFTEHYADTFPAGVPVKEEGTMLYAVDALIYNRDELNAAEGISDEQLIIDLIRSRGCAALKDVNGDFAGAALNTQTGELTLFRDHLGVRQLYYYLKDGLLAFSTDIRGLGAVPDADMTVDEEQLWQDIAGYNSSTLHRTHFAYIHCVLPGSAMTFSGDGDTFAVRTLRYFVPGKNRIRFDSDEQYIARMRELVEDSIRRRAEAIPGRIGAELSGGLDSSVIDIILNRLRPGGKYVAWRVVPDDWPLQPDDERIVVKDIVDRENMDFSYLPEADKYKWMPEGPLPVFSNTKQIGAVAELVSKDGIRVVFSGQGGDEGVSHRMSALELYRAREYRAYFHEKWFRTKGKHLRVPRFLAGAAKQILIDYPRKKQPWHAGVNALAILNPVYKEKMKHVKGAPLFFNTDPALEFEYGGIRLRPETTSCQAAEFGVRYIFPYEDHRVFDYALSIPRRLYMHNGVNRWIFRKAFGPIMPESLRKVTYKDYPSIRNERPYRDGPSQTERLQELYDVLDKKRWGAYLDFAAIEELIRTPKPDEVPGQILRCMYEMYLIQIFRGETENRPLSVSSPV